MACYSYSNQRGLFPNHGGPQRSEARKVERLLIEIGNEQMRTRKVNPRTEMWVNASTAWERAGL
jgi:hypothetical protein